MNFTEAIRSFEGQPINRQMLDDLLKDYKRPDDKITELLKQKILTQIKSKLYIPGPALRMKRPEPMLLANHIKSPSYVSLETALEYWQLIPERVYQITSATTKRAGTYTTAMGLYSYIHLPLPYYSFGLISVELAPQQVIIMATAEKALSDKLVTTKGLLFRSSKPVKAWLLEDMRMDREYLRRLRPEVLRDWLNSAPKKESLKWLIKTLEDL